MAGVFATTWLITKVYSTFNVIGLGKIDLTAVDRDGEKKRGKREREREGVGGLQDK